MFRNLEFKCFKNWGGGWEAIFKLVYYNNGFKKEKMKSRHLNLSRRKVPETENIGFWKAAKSKLRGER